MEAQEKTLWEVGFQHSPRTKKAAGFVRGPDPSAI